MAGIYKPRDIKVVIDGYSLADLAFVQINTEAETIGPFISDSCVYRMPGKTRIEIRTVHNTEIAFDVQDKTLASDQSYAVETNEDQTILYVYGPLRKLIPSLFADKDLFDWQKDYLYAYDYPKYAKYKYWRDDIEFKSVRAITFHKGYIHGRKAGEEAGRQYGREEGREIGKLEAYEERNRGRKRPKP